MSWRARGNPLMMEIAGYLQHVCRNPHHRREHGHCTLFHQTETTKMQTKPEIKPCKCHLGLLLTAKAMSDVFPQDLPMQERNQMERPNKVAQSMAMYYLTAFLLYLAKALNR